MRSLIHRIRASLRLELALFLLGTLTPFLIAFAAYDIYSQRQAQEQMLLEKGQVLAQTGARVASETFTRALSSGELTPEQLFDTRYVEIAGTAPKKYHTAYDSFTDVVFQQIEDGWLADQDVVFAAIVDRNGYLPTHNTKFGSGAASPELNRTKRLFNDPVGLAAARNADGVLRQVYKRDTGETMWDISAPIVVNGQHWGAFRVGFSIERIQDRLAATTWRLVFGMLGLLAVVVTVAVLVAGWVARAVAGVAAASAALAHHHLPALVAAVQQVASGDLTRNVSTDVEHVTVRSTDELGRMVADFNAVIDGLAETGTAFSTMTGNLRDVIGQVTASADGVASASGQLGQAASQSSDVVQQVAQAMQSLASGSNDSSHTVQDTTEAILQLGQATDGIARGASEQARQVQAVSTTAARMADGVAQVAANAQRVADASLQAKVSAEMGAAAVRETVSSMGEIQQVVSRTADKVEELGKLGEKIGAVVETIDDIAEQTNLLALNAAIEAARAGAHGKGFAVVADEVRKLAERSQRETKAIADLIRAVQAGTRDTVSAIEDGSMKVEQGSTKANEAGIALGAILEAVEATVGQVTQIATAAHQMADGAREVVDAMGSISAVVEENSAATEQMAAQAGQVTASIQSIKTVAMTNSAMSEEISASAEQMSAQVEEMTAQAEELAGTADQLKALVARFKLGAPGEAAAVMPRRRLDDWASTHGPDDALRAG
ncbi:MAG: methyl-accepting chemotaxis protein [Chloroflexota bacterium]